MKKSQKFLLWISLGMFILPEVLWSPILNLFDSFLQNSNNTIILRPNFLVNGDNINLLLIVLFIQMAGVLISLIIISKIKYNIFFKILLILIFSTLLIITAFILYFSFSIRKGIGF